MVDKLLDVFFYGLFMDADVLLARGVQPGNGRPAFVADHAIRLGAKAMLVPEVGQRAYGMVYSLTRSEMQALYADLLEYEKRIVTAHLKSGAAISVQTMVHRSPSQAAAIDPEYASQWTRIVKRLNLPF